MKVFIAGATGAIGQPLSEKLLLHGHEVFGMTRSQEKSKVLESQGVVPVVADAFDYNAVDSAMQKIKPEVVIEQLTSLPQNYTPEEMRATDELNTKLRLEGGANVQKAAQSAGVSRYIIQSAGFLYAPGEGLADESTSFAFDSTPFIARAAHVYKDIEDRVISSSEMDGIALRYGFFYGPGTWYEKEGSVSELVRQQGLPVVGDGGGVWPFIHVEDAAEATISAMERGNRGTYNIVDDDPSKVSVWLPAYAKWLEAPTPIHIEAEQMNEPDFLYYLTKLRGASNAKAKSELGFKPRKLEWLEISN